MQAVCKTEDIGEESAREFMVGEQSVIVVKFDGQFHAYLNWCPHLGIELNFMPDQFMDDDGRFLVCANHGALFEPENGACLSGPCSGDSLTAVPLDVRDGEIWVGNAEATA
ncbi:MAG: Rieske (2Fe-2S) protein [Alloalcanivorax venustensis]|jgi:nitrite reductase/ring-hydroxylating ferredoxin subunit|uniref:Ferredoxin subunits of nitrite reductase and ring-hydroxylating dioxygenases n=2 Tax=environmental samples TaxID=293334 RepID=E7C7A4_9GAMM|nr:ferredoxin subunits of nitrite reductase and ring-hydroxylating dioxygenases [uncultured Oceanospirillales bacterium HF0770_27O18]ADI23755.1 ferredoxin subunits of nitrite reductase and ring-hydroxylating dioxygenases [uncultured Oceanospirillales bacterium HF4000_43P14]KXJ48917.1 MAG: (2Fe-2S)-binding protein [Alcanivorax sp. Nap_24]MBD3650923.1 Rieske (2Fe-2S) protein [Alcanivorax sp.]MCH9784556.1 Rieske (2Fe-2S) protein [Gammaproteobacteria bacterium]MEA3261442.1 Rieske (2Fe-2S) protein |tara:strand:+ start:16581 stop:16913 length:333 start_codon:yes stop_codon:yes gene_type:complete